VEAAEQLLSALMAELWRRGREKYFPKVQPAEFQGRANQLSRWGQVAGFRGYKYERRAGWAGFCHANGTPFLSTTYVFPTEALKNPATPACDDAFELRYCLPQKDSLVTVGFDPAIDSRLEASHFFKAVGRLDTDFEDYAYCGPSGRFIAIAVGALEWWECHFLLYGFHELPRESIAGSLLFSTGREVELPEVAFNARGASTEIPQWQLVPLARALADWIESRPPLASGASAKSSRGPGKGGEPSVDAAAAYSNRTNVFQRVATATRGHAAVEDLIDLLSGEEERYIRGKTFPLPLSGSKDDQVLFPHQDECLQAIRDGGDGMSGIIHLPTGGGKTAVALAYMSEVMAADDRVRVIWATDRNQLVRQTMVRLVEVAGQFPKNISFTWADGRSIGELDLLEKHQIVFVTRHGLTNLFEGAGDGRRQENSLRRSLSRRLGQGGHRLLVVFDECHGCASTVLRIAMRGVVKKTEMPGSGLRRGRWRMLGLSATPLPNDQAARGFMRDWLFPLPDDPDDRGVRPDWEVMVYHSVSNKKLVSRGILCPVNTALEETGLYDIPAAILERECPRGLGAPADLKSNKLLFELEQFAAQFNRWVMSSDAVLEWLADRLAGNLTKLGKTLVFVPTIDAANRLTHLLVQDERVPEGGVTVVHSKLDEVDFDGELDRELEVCTQVEQYRDRERDPCIMVNVGMLTTGFDDPLIRTVVLARLTFSTNLFWQMVGRGLRGPRVDGTSDCYVIDPIKLTHLFRGLEEYRPKLRGSALSANIG